MSLKELQEELLAELSENLKHLGFRYRKAYRHFVKAFDGGRQVIHVSFINHVHDFDSTIDVAIRFDEIERIRNEGNNLVSEKEKKESATIGVELGNWKGVGQHRWSFHSLSDVSSNMPSVVEWVQELALPFFEKYIDIKEAYEALRKVVR